MKADREEITCPCSWNAIRIKCSVNNACSIRFRNPPDRRVEYAADRERRSVVSDTAFFRRRLAQLVSPIYHNRTFSLPFIQCRETQTRIVDYFTKYSNSQLCWLTLIQPLQNTLNAVFMPPSQRILFFLWFCEFLPDHGQGARLKHVAENK